MKRSMTKVFALVMASAVIGTSTVPMHMTTSVMAAQKEEEVKTSGWTFTGVNGEESDGGIHLWGEGDSFGISGTNMTKNYLVNATLRPEDKSGNVGVVLGAKDRDNPMEGAVVANVEPKTGQVRLFCFQGKKAADLQDSKIIEELKNKDSYEFNVSVDQGYVNVKINNHAVYQMRISDTMFQGYVGVISFNENLFVSDFTSAVIDEKMKDAYLSGLQVKNVDLNQEFNKDIKSYAAVVDSTVDSISLTPTVTGTGKVTVDGKAVESGKEITVPLKTGSKQICVVVTSENGATDETIVNVLRKADNSVYNVPTRPQYHFSPATSWCNDPNGMVYYKGEYHLFYQYYPDDTIWGPMHWGHAVSKDLLHWEELPMALYYQEDKGAMFSGSCVVDDTNKSGLFGKETGAGKGGLVAIYTQNNEGRGQDQCLAYSKDNGRTWTKYKANPILKWNDDPLKSDAFRDPKVFYHEESGKYMMVVAGGLLRIYSSPDLINWNIESTYSGSNDVGNSANTRIETECPDMYQLKADDGTKKWVISEGGRYYRIGEFVKEGDNWTFVQDSGSDREVMNFGPQSYAAMSYDNMPDGRRVMINWASTWEGGYCNNVSSVTGQYGYNGFFNLQTEMKVKKINGKYQLTQTPIEEYKNLRVNDAATKIEKTIPKKTESSENILSGIKASQYEIEAQLTPKEGTKEVGFKVRTNESGTKETVIKYNVETKKVTINGDKAGVIPEGQRKGDIVSDAIVTEKDGKINMRIFVDESSVEVYAQDGQVTGALAIFPTVSSTGMEVYSQGGETEAVINVYPMKSIWENKLTDNNVATDLFLSTDSGSGEYNVGDTINVSAMVSPVKAAQEVTWEISNNNGNKVSVKREAKDELQLEALKKGAVTVTATTANGVSRTIDIFISSAPDSVSLGDWRKIDGTWTISSNNNSCTGESERDAFLMSGTKTGSDDYIFETDVTYHNGQAIALLFRGQNPDSNKAYAANIDTVRNGGTARVFTFGGGTGDIGKDANYNLTSGHKYHVKVEVRGNQYKMYIDGEKILQVRDSKVKQNYSEGQYVGFNVFNGKATFQNMKVTPLEIKTPSVNKEKKLTVDDTSKLQVSNLEEDDYNLVKYKSSDPSIVQVDSDGNIRAKKAGVAKITTTVTTFGRTYTVETKVEVVNKQEAPKTITVTLKGNGGKNVAVIQNVKAGSKLPKWSNSKYKSAGKKGYAFAGWTYGGKVITAVPSTTEDITISAKFSKMSVGRASKLTLKGMKGSGTGFIAASSKYTSKNGNVRGFRYRYATNSKMKKAKYKTTGLAKNVYTKKSLKKGKRYYVQVRYYYYDSTNQRVYGTYSKAKSVKAY